VREADETLVQDGEPARARVEDADRPCVHSHDSRGGGGQPSPTLQPLPEVSDTWRVSAGQAVSLASRPFPWKLLVRAGLTVVLLALVAAAIAAVLWLRS
jgi:hypothetical protein